MASLGNQEEVDYYRNDSPGVVVSKTVSKVEQRQQHRARICACERGGGGRGWLTEVKST